MNAQLYGTLAEVVLWSVMVPLIVAQFLVQREPALYLPALFGMLMESALAVLLDNYWLPVILVLMFLVDLVRYIVRIDEYYETYNQFYGIPKEYLPSWARDTPNLAETMHGLEQKNIAVTGELIYPPKPADIPTKKTTKRTGYHRPEAVAERSGEFRLTH